MSQTSPKLWQWLFPRHGNWGGPGYSAGVYNNTPALTDWSVNGKDKMDFAFKRHDYAYQRGRDRIQADRRMIMELRQIKPKDIRAKIYRIMAVYAFEIHIWWQETMNARQ